MSGAGITLSAKETQMLIAIASLMGDVPTVDYEMVASKCGIGYGRNARTSAKKLFEKLRNAAGVEGTAATDAASNTVADGEAADDGAVKKPKAKKAPVKKGVGKVTAPKKASGGVPKKPRKGKGKKEEAKAKTKGEEDSDAEMDEAGKSFNSNTSVDVSVEASSASSPEHTTTGNDQVAPFVGQVAASPARQVVYSEADLYEAEIRGISIELWLQFKAANY